MSATFNKLRDSSFTFQTTKVREGKAIKIQLYLKDDSPFFIEKEIKLINFIPQ